MNTLFPGEPRGHLAGHLNTLAAMVSGIVGSRSTNFPAIASKVPVGTRNQVTKAESRVKRFERWPRNETVESETFFLPFAEALFLSLIDWFQPGPEHISLCLDGARNWATLGVIHWDFFCRVAASSDKTFKRTARPHVLSMLQDRRVRPLNVSVGRPYTCRDQPSTGKERASIRHTSL
jgi:hypothetical protein